MGTYTPEKFPVPTGYDDIGLHLAMPRLPGEDIIVYRRRLLLELRDRSGPTQREFVKSISRKVGRFDDRIARIEFTGDIADPAIKITSSCLKLYSDYQNDVVELELNLADRAGAYFLTDVADAVNSTDHFTWTWLVEIPEAYFYLKSSALLYGDNLRCNQLQSLPNNYVYDFGPDWLGVPRQLWSANYAIFQNRVDVDSIVEPGDFALYRDEDGHMILTTEDLMSGSLYFEWSEWPYDIRLAQVRAYPYNDADVVYRHRDAALSETTGEPTPVHLNSVGARVARAALAANPLEWGT